MNAKVIGIGRTGTTTTIHISSDMGYHEVEVTGNLLDEECQQIALFMSSEDLEYSLVNMSDEKDELGAGADPEYYGL